MYYTLIVRLYVMHNSRSGSLTNRNDVSIGCVPLECSLGKPVLIRMFT